MMKATVINKEKKGSERLELGQIPIPALKEGEVLVRVHYAGINRADLLQREGNYPVPQGDSETLGLEISGAVDQVGPSVNPDFKGKRVMALVGGGGYAEYCVVPKDLLMEIPESLSFQEAAAIPEAFLTAWQCISFHGNLDKTSGKTVLWHAGASGVGVAAIQILKMLPNFTVIVTVGSAEKAEKCKKIGADHVINYNEEDFVQRVHEITQRKGVDFLLDCVGQSYFEKNLQCMALDSMWVIIGFLSGTNVSGFNMGAILRNRITIKGTTLRSRSHEYKAELTKSFLNFALEKLRSKAITAVVDSVFPLEHARDGHAYVEQNKNFGKVLLQVTSEHK